MVIISFKGVVEALEKELIPKIYLAKIRDLDGKYYVEMDMHEELFVTPQGSRVEFTISRELPQYRDGVDFVGRATFVTARKEDEKRKYLFSIGGLIVILYSNEDLDIQPTEKVYIKIAKI